MKQFSQALQLFIQCFHFFQEAARGVVLPDLETQPNLSQTFETQPILARTFEMTLLSLLIGCLCVLARRMCKRKRCVTECDTCARESMCLASERTRDTLRRHVIDDVRTKYYYR